MLKNLGLTIMELLIVLVIVGILAALRFSDFGRLNEKNKGVEAEANLYLIYNAQKRYALENKGVYYSCDPCDKSDIMDKLEISLDGKNFNYTISSTISPAAFSATAERLGGGGLCGGKIMTIDQAGGKVEKEECPQW